MFDKFLAVNFCGYLLFVIFSCTTQPISRKVFIEDKAQLFTLSQIRTIDSLLGLHEKKTTNEIVIITTDDYTPHSDIESYALEYLRSNAVGKKDIDNGTVVVVNAKHREVRIGTGYGTEQILRDEIAGRIIDSIMIPHFVKGDYYAGVWEGTTEITRFLEVDSNKISAVHSQMSRNNR